MKREKVKNQFDFLPKSKIKAGDGQDVGAYPFFTSSENQTKYLDSYLYEPGCLIFGTGGKANVHFASNRFAVSTDCITIRPKPDACIDAEYFFRYLQENMQILQRGFRGAGLEHISKAYIERIKIPKLLPPLEDQIRVSNLLRTFEGLFARRKEHLLQLDELLKSIFHQMFGDPVLNEKGWKKEPFSSLLLAIESGKSPKCEAREASEREWGVLKLGAVTSCFFKESENKALPQNVIPKSKLEVKTGDLLFSRKNTYELVAASAYIFSTRPRLLMSDLIFRFIFKEDAEVNPIFIWKLLVSDHQRKKIQSLAGGAAGSMPNISKSRLRQVLLPIPPKNLQDQFASIVVKAEGIKSRYKHSLSELENLYGALSQKAFKGELDLSRIPLYLEAKEKVPTEYLPIVEQVIPESLKETLANLNSFNQATASMITTHWTPHIPEFNVKQTEAIKAVAKQFSVFSTPFEELKCMAAITETVEQFESMLVPLNLAHMTEISKIAELGKSISLNVPSIDFSWLEQQNEEIRKAMEPFESMRIAMESISKPFQDFQVAVPLFDVPRKRLQTTIPVFTPMKKRTIDPGESEFDNEEETPKCLFTVEDVTTVFKNADEPLSFESLLEQLGELETVDLEGFDTIKEILFTLLSEKQISQRFDEKLKTLLLSISNQGTA